MRVFEMFGCWLSFFWLMWEAKSILGYIQKIEMKYDVNMVPRLIVLFIVNLFAVRLACAEPSVDSLIEKYLGLQFRRARVDDIYPLKSGINKELKIYTEYVRKDLRTISQGEILKYYKIDFDGDNFYDYVVVVSNPKKKKNMLLVLNKDKVLYLETFKDLTHLEPLNYGRCPTVVPTKKGKREIKSPAIRLVSFEEDSYVFYLDKVHNEWKREVLAY